MEFIEKEEFIIGLARVAAELPHPTHYWRPHKDFVKKSLWSWTGRSGLCCEDIGQCGRGEEDLHVRLILRDIDAVAADALMHSDDDVLPPVEVAVKGAARIAAGGLNRRLDNGAGSARPDNSDQLTVRSP